MMIETIKITDEAGTTYEFEKPVESIVLYEVTQAGYIFGRVFYNMEWYPEVWKASDGSSMSSEVNLTPIKKPWYEDEANFPALVWDNLNEYYEIMYRRVDISDNMRLATQAEVYDLYYEGKM